ncbi:prepilin-type N-terminal cleavage/methylation domain-containing protein [Halodesulfovibrio aestuarii]|uniref:Prepilin-type N-terminal cleavage/methylation domain-containing protein n=1 Tax=Halodesulfovibrio aestuarii TaxID=126333 RepID=A0A8G2CA87_9BACT|nr:prepilin-type N-terminal cleavage/methylation domain-containing protein [Halodesulfovibrio aestuarii]SHJ27698.1 Type IV pilin N-term methylation site GFxxxE [Halodesulfovibrio aestuarii]
MHRIRPETPPQKKRHHGNAGFTIVEVLVALVLLGVAVMMTITLTTQNQDNLAQTRWQDTAIILAREKLFELEQDGFSATTSKYGDFGSEHPGFEWQASAHATNKTNIYRLLLTVSVGKKENCYVTIEKLFKE